MDSREYKPAVVEYYSVVGVLVRWCPRRYANVPRRWNERVKSVPSENNVK